MAAVKALEVRVVSPVETVFEGEGISLVLPAWDGRVGILPGHAPFITLLGGGELEIELPGGSMERFFLNRGVAKVEDDRVTVLSEYAGRGAPEGFEAGKSWIDPEELTEEAPDGGIGEADIGGPVNPLA